MFQLVLRKTLRSTLDKIYTKIRRDNLTIISRVQHIISKVASPQWKPYVRNLQK